MSRGLPLRTRSASAAPDYRPPPESGASYARSPRLSHTAGPAIQYRTDVQNSAPPVPLARLVNACRALRRSAVHSHTPPLVRPFAFPLPRATFRLGNVAAQFHSASVRITSLL